MEKYTYLEIYVGGRFWNCRTKDEWTKTIHHDKFIALEYKNAADGKWYPAVFQSNRINVILPKEPK